MQGHADTHERACELIGADDGAIGLVDEARDIALIAADDAETLDFMAFGGLYKQIIGRELRLPISTGIMGAAARLHQTVLVNVVATDPLLGRRCRRTSCRGWSARRGDRERETVRSSPARDHAEGERRAAMLLGLTRAALGEMRELLTELRPLRPDFQQRTRVRIPHRAPVA